jgi:predicted DNA-binding transcriptional regulator AlpA
MPKNLNTKQVMALAGVSHMTVYQWRAGTATRDALPSYEGSRPRSVEFKPGELKAWAKRYGIPLKLDPVQVAAGAVTLKLPAKKTATQAVAKRAKATKKRTRH